MTTATPRRLPHPAAPSPAEAATDLGLDLDGDGSRWHPAPIGTVVPWLALSLVLVAIVFGIVFGHDLAVWASLNLGGR